MTFNLLIYLRSEGTHLEPTRVLGYEWKIPFQNVLAKNGVPLLWKLLNISGISY